MKKFIILRIIYLRINIFIRSGKSTTETFQSATVAFIKIDGFSDFSKEKNQTFNEN